MRGRLFHISILPLLLVAGLGACASNAVQPGIVYTSGVPSGSGPGPTPSGNGPYYGNGPSPSYGNSPYGSAPQQASAPAQSSNYAGAPGDSGRVVSIREVAVQGGSGGGGASNGTLIGGLLGAAGGATIGAVTSHTLGGGIVGAVLGLVGGAIAGTIATGNHGYAARGIEVTVQRDDGQQVTVAQRDDGDIQLGDRVQVVQNRQGVAQVVRDTTRAPD
jgi:outer membrane lipoprotein SlyB